MRKRDNLTVIVARSTPSPARRFTISKNFLASMGVAVIVIFSAFALSTLHYYYMWRLTTDHDGLKVEVDQLRKENETFRLSARQLNEKLSSLEVTSKKLEILSGVDEQGLGGVGGPTVVDRPLLRLDSSGLDKYFKSLERKSISLGNKLKQLQEIYNTRSILLSATPAVIPVRGYPSGGFGYRTDPFSGRREFHPGIDLSAPKGNKVIAAADGVVTFAGRKYGYGKLVKLEHRFGIATRYGHLDRVTVKPGQKVVRGDIIGYVGETGRATGPHLHYEVRFHGRALNPFQFFREPSE